MISLRSFGNPDRYKTFVGVPSSTGISGLQFRTPTFLGNIGESLDLRLWDEDDHEEEVLERSHKDSVNEVLGADPAPNDAHHNRFERQNR